MIRCNYLLLCRRGLGTISAPRRGLPAPFASLPGARATSRPNGWWSRGGSNSRPPHCERGALPAELRPRNRWWSASRSPAVAVSGARAAGRSRRRIRTSVCGLASAWHLGREGGWCQGTAVPQGRPCGKQGPMRCARSMAHRVWVLALRPGRRGVARRGKWPQRAFCEGIGSPPPLSRGHAFAGMTGGGGVVADFPSLAVSVGPFQMLAFGTVPAP
jgi:hypothetical protein